MNSGNNKLTFREREQLMELLHDQLLQQTMSTEEIRRVGIDQYGITYDLGGSTQGVLIGESGIPRVISEEQTRFLDCGHAIVSPSQVLGKCDNDHVLCNMHGHRLLRCFQCGKLLCDLCAEIDEKGRPKCPNHGFFWNILYKLAGL